MNLVDISDNLSLERATELYQATSAQTDPLALQIEYAKRIRDIHHTAGYISLSTRGLKPGQYRITRTWMNAGDPSEYRDNWKFGHLLPIHTGGFLGEMIRTPTPKLVHNLFLKDDPVLGDTLADIGTAVVCPIFEGGLPLNWGMSLRHEAEGFNKADLDEFFHRANLVGGMVRGLVMARQVRELNRQLTSQLEQIAGIQRALLPDRTPEVPGVAIATSYLTSDQSGGDYYDFFPMPGGNLGVLIADVAGHGAGAATVMAMMQTMLQDYAPRANGPADMLAHANEQLSAKRIENNFVTAWMGVIDSNRKTLTYANAGHHHPLRRLAPGRILEINGAGSLPLGVMTGIPYEQGEVKLENGETLVLYTDGIPEAFSPPPDKEMFGLGRLTEAVEESEGNPECVIEAIHERLYDHTHARDRADDQTIVAMKIDR